MTASFTTVSALGAGPTLRLPMGMSNWYGIGGSGMSFLVNFSGSGVGTGGSSASGTVTVQVSNDPNANPNLTAAQQATARWNNHDTLVNLTTDKNSSVVFPIAYTRLYCTSYGSGVIYLMIGTTDASAPQ